MHLLQALVLGLATALVLVLAFGNVDQDVATVFVGGLAVVATVVAVLFSPDLTVLEGEAERLRRLAETQIAPDLRRLRQDVEQLQRNAEDAARDRSRYAQLGAGLLLLTGLGLTLIARRSRDSDK